jgi:hypothetical protein
MMKLKNVSKVFQKRERGTAGREIFDVNEKILGWSGFWPVDQESKGSRNKIQRMKTFLFLCVCFGGILYPQYLFIRANLENLTEVSVCISMGLSNILQVLKMLVYIRYRKVLSDVVVEMRSEWKKCIFIQGSHLPYFIKLQVFQIKCWPAISGAQLASKAKSVSEKLH